MGTRKLAALALMTLKMAAVVAYAQVQVPGTEEAARNVCQILDLGLAWIYSIVAMVVVGLLAFSAFQAFTSGSIRDLITSRWTYVTAALWLTPFVLQGLAGTIQGPLGNVVEMLSAYIDIIWPIEVQNDPPPC